MTDLPVPAHLTSPVETLDPAEASIARFLARVAALTPTQWGQLDAIGQRLQAGDPLTRWNRARRGTAIAGAVPVIRDLVTPVLLAIELLIDAEIAIYGWTRAKRHALARADAASRPVSADVQRLLDAHKELRDIVRMQPGGPGAAAQCLGEALTALHSRPRLPPAVFAELYAPVEPVIPASSL